MFNFIITLILISVDSVRHVLCTFSVPSKFVRTWSTKANAEWEFSQPVNIFSVAVIDYVVQPLKMVAFIMVVI